MHEVLLPMFPLNATLLPGSVMPLNVFEDRYRALAHRCAPQREPFGSVMIERGSDVGGGDERSHVGCLAQIARHVELRDGRWFMVVIGTERIIVDEWLDDDPYPRAVVSTWPDGDDDVSDDEREQVVARVRRLRALASEAGLVPASADIDAELVSIANGDPTLFSGCEEAAEAPWSFRLSGLLPLGTYDRYKLLGATSPAERLSLLAPILEHLEAACEVRIADAV